MKNTSIGLALAGLLLAMPVQAQYQMQQGNVLDANPYRGSGGLNTPVRGYDYGAGNRIVTGNVSGGRSFQGYSAIRDANTLYLNSGYGYGGSRSGYGTSGLPSDRLSNFQRDSYGMTNYTASTAGITRSVVTTTAVPTAVTPAANYYAPPSTVTNTGAILAGANRPGSSQVLSQYAAPSTVTGATRNPLLSSTPGSPLSSLSVSPRILRATTTGQGNQPINQKLLASSLMGGVRSVPLDQLSAQALAEQGDLRSPGMPLDTRVARLEPQDRRVDRLGGHLLDGWGEPSAAADKAGGAGTAFDPNAARANRQLSDLQITSGSVFDQMKAQADDMQARQMQENLLRRRLEQPADGEAGDQESRSRHPVRPGDARVGALARSLRSERAVSRNQEPGVSRLLETPGTDLLRLRQARPADEPFNEGQEPSETSGVPGQTPPSAVSLRTFVGTDEFMANRYMINAENLLKTGQYYSAASMYDMARMLDMESPLPLLGRAMAFLGAGDYMSSVRNLYEAINMFQGLAYFKLDLAAFIPDVNILDKRRADLESRLEKHEDSNLRFLLGYAEYCSGLARQGLTNMEKAAKDNPEVRDNTQRFVEVLAKTDVEPQTPAELLQRAREKSQSAPLTHDRNAADPDSQEIRSREDQK